MPIPFILGAIAIGTAAGVGAGIKGIMNNNEANDINNLANDTIDTAKENLDKAKQATQYSLEALGREKIYVFNVSIKRFIESFEKLKNVDISDSVGIDDINKLKFDKAYFNELKECSLQITSMLVSGGLLGGPALWAVMGFVSLKASSKKLDDAYSNLAEANKISEELETLRVSTNAIRRRIQMFERLLIRVDSLYSKAIDNLEEVINQYGVDYSSYSEEAKKVVASNIKLTQTIKAILDTPILTDNGSISEESTKLLENCKL